MRCDQYMGITPEAQELLAQNVQIDVCPCCKRAMPINREVIGHYDGMFGDQYDLHRIPLKEGYAVEFLQEDPWSSGPMFFIGLTVYNGVLERTFKWSDDEIQIASTR